MIARTVALPSLPRCAMCPRTYRPRYRRQGVRIVVSQTCGRVCANRLIAKRRQWTGAA